MSFNYSDNELKHFGIKGMKWGVRRYQNKDGSLTPAGKKRYADDDVENSERSRRAGNVKKLKSAQRIQTATAAAALGSFAAMPAIGMAAPALLPLVAAAPVGIIFVGGLAASKKASDVAYDDYVNGRDYVTTYIKNSK